MKIEFVNYTGCWPTLCSGVATFKVDGKEIKFGHEPCSYDFKTNSYPDDNYDSFWYSGGSTGFNDDYSESYIDNDDWQFEDHYWKKADEKHPQWIIDILPELLKVFNENVEHGCCGGCL